MVSIAAYFGDEEESNFNRTFYNNAPYIEQNQDDVTLDVGGNFTVRCKDKVKVTWLFPKHIESTGAVQVEEIDSFDSTYPYSSQLTILSMDHTLVGFFYCVQAEEYDGISENFDELVDTFRATPFYIFVDGE